MEQYNIKKKVFGWLGAEGPSKKALSMVELMLAVFIFSIFSIGIFTLSLDVVDRDVKFEYENEALQYAQEGLEATRNIRDQNYLLLVNGTYGLDLTNDLWSFVASPENILDFYSRSIEVEDVYRNVSGDIADSGTLDPKTKKITSTVSWNIKNVFPRSVSLTEYLTSWAGEDVLWTTCAEFDTGTYSQTMSATTSPPPVDNCVVTLTTTEQFGTFFTEVGLGEHADDVVAMGDYVYVVTERNTEGFSVANVADPQNPYVIDTVDVEGKGRYVAKDGSYVFVSVQSSTKGLAIVDVTDPANSVKIASLNVGAYGNEIAVSGNYLFMGTNSSSNSFKVINVTNKNSPSVAASLNVGGIVKSIAVSGNYAYLGLDDDFHGVKVVDISNPLAPSVVASLNVGEDVRAIKVNGSFAYIGMNEDHNSFKVLNVANPLAPSIIATLNINQEINDIAYQDGYVYASLDNNSPSLIAINVSNPFSPYSAYTFNASGKGTGIDTDADNVYMGIAVNNTGLVITDTVSTSVATNGNYTSNILDTGSVDTRLNFIEWTPIDVPGGSVKLQIRTADTQQNIASATWVGPDGTNASFFETTPSVITPDPLATGTRFLQAIQYYTSNGVTSPAVENFKINYTP